MLNKIIMLFSRFIKDKKSPIGGRTFFYFF